MSMNFSVAMSVYKNDNPVFFDAALKSIIDLQTVKPMEIVLVVDGPVPEETNGVLAAYEARNEGLFKIIRLPENRGLGNALKLAVENASYELIARMDSDDIAIPTRFEEQIKFMSENDVDIVGGHIFEFVGEESNIVSRRSVFLTNEDIKADMKRRCPFNHMTVMFKKSAVQSVGGYLDWHYNEDYYLWLRMFLAGCKFANLDKELVYMRVGAEMYQRRGGKKYYLSEKGLQQYMLEKKIIDKKTYRVNVLKRWLVQRAMPNFLRGWVFRVFARKKA